MMLGASKFKITHIYCNYIIDYNRSCILRITLNIMKEGFGIALEQSQIVIRYEDNKETQSRNKSFVENLECQVQIYIAILCVLFKL